MIETIAAHIQQRAHDRDNRTNKQLNEAYSNKHTTNAK